MVECTLQWLANHSSAQPKVSSAMPRECPHGIHEYMEVQEVQKGSREPKCFGCISDADSEYWSWDYDC